MVYELRIIYKDGCCAVYPNCRSVITTYKGVLVYSSIVNKPPIIIDSSKFKHIKAFKIALKEYESYE